MADFFAAVEKDECGRVKDVLPEIEFFRKRAEEAMKNAKNDIDFAKAQGEFATMAAQIAAISKLRKKR